MVIDQKFKLKFKSVSMQTLLLCCCFFFLTGGAFLMPWEYHLFLEVHQTLFQILIGTTLLVALGIAWRLFSTSPDAFFTFEPMRSIKIFFEIPSYLSVSAVFLAYFLTQFLSQSLAHSGLETSLWDLGLYDQVIWNTAHGNFLITSIRGGFSIFCERFKPMLALLSPLYLISNSTFLLFFVISLVGASSVIAIYLITQSLTKSKQTALLFSICCFFYLPLRNGLNFLFHTQVLSDPLLLFGFYFVIKKWNLWAYLFFFLALTCKESVAMDVLGIGLFCISRHKRTGWGIGILALFWITLLIFFIDPHFHYPYTVQDKWSFYSHLFTMKLEPWSKILAPNPFWFLFLVFAPFLFLPLKCKGWYYLFGPSLALRLLSAWPGFRMITAHYTAGLNALVFIAAIYGFHEITKPSGGRITHKHLDRLGKLFKNVKFLRLAVLVVALLFSGNPQLFSIERHLWEASYFENQKAIQVLESIPSEYSVLATETAAAHLSHRPHLFVFFSMFAHAPFEKLAQTPDLIVVDKLKLQPREQEMLANFITRGYSLDFESKIIQIYERPSEPKLISAALLTHWQEISQEHKIPYRKIVRKWYKYILIMTVTVFILAFFRKKLTGR